MKSVKQYSKDQIWRKYCLLSYKKKTQVLNAALDFMQQYNGRSKMECIALGMGYEPTDDDMYEKC